MSGNIRLYNTNGYVELQAPSSASAQVLELPTDSIKPALVHLHTETFSAVSSVSIDDVFSSTYDNYRVVVNVASSSTSTDYGFKFRSSGVDTTVSSYYGSGFGPQYTGATIQYGSRANGSVSVNVGQGAASQPHVVDVDFYNPALARRTGFVGKFWDASGFIGMHVWGGITTTTTYDGITLLSSVGTITGTLRIYGYRNS